MANQSLKVWFDFLCPWARIGVLWIRNVEATGELGYDIEWKAFSLENINLPEDASADELWSTPAERRGLLPLAAAKWAETQGAEVFEAVQRRFFDGRHVDKLKIGQPDVTAEVLTSVGQDGPTVVAELLDNPKWLEAARADYDEAAELKIFGVPTFAFPDRAPVFLRLMEVVDGARALEVFRSAEAAAMDPVIHELKRPSFY